MRDAADDPDLGELIRFGKIAEVDLATGFCVVETGDLTTNKVRWLENRAGATRSWAPPSVGEQVLLLCPGGEFSAAVAIGGLSSNDHPPAGSTKREIRLYEDGAILAYDAEAHKLEIVLPEGGSVRIVGLDGITLEGDVLVKGKLTVEQDVLGQADVKAGDISLQDHVHGNVQSGGSTTGAPQ